MRQIKYLENGEEKLFEIENNIPIGVVEFNKNLISKKTEDLKSFNVKSKGKNVNVDLENGDIQIDGNIVDLKLGETKAKLNITNLRWINFHRKAVSYRMAGLVSTKSIAYGIGWQAQVDGENIKRYVLVTDEGFTLESE